MIQNCLNIIRKTAKIPSFSSFEERIHPLIFDLCRQLGLPDPEIIANRNLIVTIPGKASGRVALTAHLDKINHFGADYPAELPYSETDTKLRGQLDNTAGIGLAMALGAEAKNRNWPDIQILLSEMEESYGLRHHPELMRNGGKNLNHGIGAKRISLHLLDKNQLPELVITLDTTPLFKGEPGVAVYSKHWEFTKTEPSAEEISLTKHVVDQLIELDAGLLLANNTNDYLTYGKTLNAGSQKAIPSIAVEPSIEPYHTQNEEVFVDDLRRILDLLSRFLDEYETRI